MVMHYNMSKKVFLGLRQLFHRGGRYGREVVCFIVLLELVFFPRSFHIFRHEEVMIFDAHNSGLSRAWKKVF
jgi:hypothetical protein